MTRYWCYHCDGEHDSARDCPQYSSLKDEMKYAEKVTKRVVKRTLDADRRNKMHAKNPPSNVGCVAIGVALLGGWLAAVYTIAEGFFGT